MALRSCLFYLFSLCLLCTTLAQDRAPHGLAYQSPIAFSPSAYDFFHPDAHRDSCTKSNCSPLPLAAQVHETQPKDATAATTSEKMSSHSKEARLIVAPLFGILVIAFLAMGAYYIAKTRQANSIKAKALQPDV